MLAIFLLELHHKLWRSCSIPALPLCILLLPDAPKGVHNVFSNSTQKLLVHSKNSTTRDRNKLMVRDSLQETWRVITSVLLRILTTATQFNSSQSMPEASFKKINSVESSVLLQHLKRKSQPYQRFWLKWTKSSAFIWARVPVLLVGWSWADGISTPTLSQVQLMQTLYGLRLSMMGGLFLWVVYSSRTGWRLTLSQNKLPWTLASVMLLSHHEISTTSSEPSRSKTRISPVRNLGRMILTCINANVTSKYSTRSSPSRLKSDKSSSRYQLAPGWVLTIPRMKNQSAKFWCILMIYRWQQLINGSSVFSFCRTSTLSSIR